jgi:signal transduction histidine kinase
LPNRPRVQFDGPVDAVAGPSGTEDLVAACRELLSNVVRHAGAQHVDLLVAVVGDGVAVRVEDDGVGIDGCASDRGGLGLRNLAARAERVGGTFRITRRPQGGTSAEWWVPTPLPAG